MKWSVFLIIAAACLIGSVIFAIIRGKRKYKSGRILDPAKILFAGVVVSALVLFIPLYINAFKTNDCGLIEAVFIAIHNMLKLFVVEGEFDLVISSLEGSPAWVFTGYTVMLSALFAFAPILTFGFVLSFFKNILAYARYIWHFKSKVYIFSELNEKSLALAKSVKDSGKNGPLLVFTDVFEKEEEESYELVEKAKELRAICFKKDIVTINFTVPWRRSEINFFTIGEDQTENIGQSLNLIKKFKYRENTNLYVFSTSLESEILLSNAFNNPEDKSASNDIKIKVRRVNEVQSLINRTLYEQGYEKIFLSAYPEDGIKRINAVIVGMGHHGTVMTKSLAWFCQMDGYLVEINAFDVDKLADEKFISQCPELMEYSGKLDIDGEAKYTINIHPETDVEAISFDEKLASLPMATYVFVALGSDDKNIATAVKLRSLYARLGYNPIIQAVVSNIEKKEALSGVLNFNGQSYDIDFIGDVKSSYSKEVILDSDVESAALERHLHWGKESTFWQYDYNYKSSVASAIHRKMKILCGIPGIEKVPENRTEEELWNIRILEHCRWNAYMRSEGYVYAGSVEKSARNDLAKMHNCLVPFKDLPLKEQEKDDD